MLPASAHLDRSLSPADRRVHLRQPVRSLAYVELGEGNGGIVLNISEGGMAIQAVMSLREPELPLIRVQLAHSKKQIQAKGRIAWTTDLRKQVGIEFVDLSDEARSQIREWVSLEAPAEEPLAADSVSDSVSEEPASGSGYTEREIAERAKSAREALRSQARYDATAPPAAAKDSQISKPPASPDRFDRPERPARTVVPAALVQPAFVPSKPVSVSSPAAKAVPPAVAPSSAPVKSALSEQAEKPAEAAPKEVAPPLATQSFPDPTPVVAAVPPKVPVALAETSAVEPRELAPLPADRFGFKPSLIPKLSLNVASRKSPKNWRLTTWAVIFLAVSLSAGWFAGHGALHGIFQRIAGSPGSSHVAAEEVLAPAANPSNISDIDAIDLSGQHWLIPMQGPLDTPRYHGTGYPHTQDNMNLREWALSTPVHPESSAPAAKTPAAPVLPSMSSSDSILPPGTTDAHVSLPTPPPPPVAENSSPTGLLAGQLLQKVEPVYPPELMEQKVEGTVRLLAVISESGNVTSVQPLSGPRLLYPAAMDAVRQWRYSPTTLNGRPIQTERQVTMVFQLTNPQ